MGAGSALRILFHLAMAFLHEIGQGMTHRSSPTATGGVGLQLEEVQTKQQLKLSVFDAHCLLSVET